MNRVRPEEILPWKQFQAERPRHLARVLAAQAARRLGLGPNMTLLFENRETVRWQVQEMVRIEQLSRPEAIQHELDTYNKLLPDSDCLSATLLIEYPDAGERERMVRALVGLHERLFLVLGERRVPARFDQEQFNAERVSTVQFLRLPLDAEARAALSDLDRPASLLVDHPSYHHSTPLTRSFRGALLDDLAEASAVS